MMVSKFNRHNKNLAPSGELYKKSLGQHFLRNLQVAHNMIDQVTTADKTIVEIGCGDGALTDLILEKSNCKELVVIEIDPFWANFVMDKHFQDPRITIKNCNIMDFDFGNIGSHNLILLANLPYNLSFPIIKKIVEQKEFFSAGVFMVQEEVAQKICATRGKDRGAISVYLQTFLELKLLEKVSPKDFEPAPKVFSRTVYFKTKDLTDECPAAIKIVNNHKFWELVRKTFHHPRQTLMNNLKKEFPSASWINKVDSELGKKRAAELELKDFFNIWNISENLEKGSL